MNKQEWGQIEKDFIEWDNATHSNASQRQILDWFKERLQIEQEEKTAIYNANNVACHIYANASNPDDKIEAFIDGAIWYKSQFK